MWIKNFPITFLKLKFVQTRAVPSFQNSKNFVIPNDLPFCIVPFQIKLAILKFGVEILNISTSDLHLLRSALETIEAHDCKTNFFPYIPVLSYFIKIFGS